MTQKNRIKRPYSKGVAIEMAIIAMMIIIALCITMLSIAGFSIQNAKRTMSESETRGISDWSASLIIPLLSKYEDENNTDRLQITDARKLLTSLVGSEIFEELCKKTDVKIYVASTASILNPEEEQQEPEQDEPEEQEKYNLEILDNSYLLVKITYPKAEDGQPLGSTIFCASFKLSGAVAAVEEPLAPEVPFTSKLLRFTYKGFELDPPNEYTKLTELTISDFMPKKDPQSQEQTNQENNDQGN